MRPVNLRRESCDVRCDRATPLGNPFPMQCEADRETVIANYRQWLWAKMQAQDSAVMAQLLSIKEGDRLGCWCAPKPCHCDVIINARRWYKAAYGI